MALRSCKSARDALGEPIHIKKKKKNPYLYSDFIVDEIRLGEIILISSDHLGHTIFQSSDENWVALWPRPHISVGPHPHIILSPLLQVFQHIAGGISADP